MPVHDTYGWIPELPDHRDHLYAAPPEVMAKLSKKKDLRPGCPPVYTQGKLNTCTAQAIAAAIQFDLKKQGAPIFMPSRLFVYYNERELNGTVASDAGARIRDGIKAIARRGVCPESEWPYDPAKVTHKPTAPCYKIGKKFKALSYKKLAQTSLHELKGCIASGYPFVFGFTAYHSFRSDAVAKTGHLQMPKPKEKAIGGHAVMAVGYDDSSERFIVRNSWDKDWGIKGYFTMPYAYITNLHLTHNFWTIRVVS